jgi:hypothetical protein
VAKELKVGVLEQMYNIPLAACVKVVYTEHIIALFQEAITKVGAEEPGAAGCKDAFSVVKHVYALAKLRLKPTRHKDNKKS